MVAREKETADPSTASAEADSGRDDNVYVVRTLYAMQALCMSYRHCVSHGQCVCRTGIPDAQGSTIIRINKYIVIPSEP